MMKKGWHKFASVSRFRYENVRTIRPEKSGLEVEHEDLFRSRLLLFLDHAFLVLVLADAID